MGKRKNRAPGIVPRFLKQAVTVGAIPALAAACHQPQKTQPPVVAYYAPLPPPGKDAQQVVQPAGVAAYTPDRGPAVVAAYHPSPPVLRPDAAVDARPADAPPAKRSKAGPKTGPQIEPPVVAAYQKDLEPAVVAAYVPRDDEKPAPVKPAKKR